MALNSNQINVIQFTLESLVEQAEKKYVTTKRIFSEVKGLIDLDYDKFTLAITYLINTGGIAGFTLLPNGNIYAAGNVPLSSPEIDIIRPDKNLPTTSIIIDGKGYVAHISSNYLIKILHDILQAKESPNGSVVLNTRTFDCDAGVLYRFLESFYGIETNAPN